MIALSRFFHPAGSSHADAQPPLLRFVILSVLLHTLAVVLFGDTGDRIARSGGVPWGSLDVTLQRKPYGRDAGADVAPAADSAAPVAAPRSVTQRAPDPSASQQAQPAATPFAGAQPPPGIAASPESPQHFEALPHLDSNATEEADKTYTPFATVLPDIERQPVLPGEQKAPEAQQPLESLPVPQLQKQLPPLIESMPPVLPVEPPAAAVEQPLLPQSVLKIDKPRVIPALPEIALPPQIEPAPAIERKSLEAPRAATLQTERISPAKIDDLPALPETRVREETLAAPAPADSTVQPGAQSETASPAALAPRSPQGLPGMVADSVKPRGATPPPEGGARPRIDLDSIRGRAREIASEGSGARRLLPFPMPPQPEYKSKEARAIEKALKPDCRTAYADMGLAAVAPLVWSAVTENGCKW